jgi:hypothetical protein
VPKPDWFERHRATFGRSGRTRIGTSAGVNVSSKIPFQGASRSGTSGGLMRRR